MPDHLPDPTATDQRPNELPDEDPTTLEDRGALEPGALTSSGTSAEDSDQDASRLDVPGR